MFLPPRIHSTLLNLGLLIPLSPKSLVLLPPPPQLPPQPRPRSLSTPNRRLLRNKMPRIIERDIPHPSSLHATIPTEPRPRHSQLIRIHLGETDVGITAEHVQDAGAEMRKLREDLARLWTVEGVCTRVIGVEVGVCGSVDGGGVGTGGIIVVGARVGENLLMKRTGQRNRFLILLFPLYIRVNGRRQIAQTILHPPLQHAWIPGLVEGTLLVRVGGGFARRPEIAAVGGELGGFGDEFGARVYEGGGLALDDGIEEDEGVEDAGVHKGELCSSSSFTVSDC